MKVVLYAAALRASYGVGVGEPVEIDDEVATHYLNVGVARAVKGRTVETATAGPDENAALDLSSMTKDELVALAEERGLEVEREDGEGDPLKADYLRALEGG